jgi:vacuolar-type H+-ATPase subunit B/Vma2
LKRDGKKDVRPVSAEVFQLESGVVVVYVFPMSAEISRKDGQVRFEAQIGRIVVGQTFELGEMEFMGKLEL